MTISNRYAMDILRAVGAANVPTHTLLAIDVFGEHAEPIRNYKSCYHKFSEHFLDSHICRCHYPTNTVVGLSVKLNHTT